MCEGSFLPPAADPVMAALLPPILNV
jgi:hypothetical protein